MLFNFALIDYLLSSEKSSYAERRQYVELMHKRSANNDQFTTSEITRGKLREFKDHKLLHCP